jgi:hypothetical protein
MTYATTDTNDLMKDWTLTRLPLRSQLGDHPLDLHSLSTIRFLSKQLESIHVLSLQGFFACTSNHAAFHPHLDTLRRLEICTLWDESCSKSLVASTQDFVVEGLLEGQNFPSRAGI